MKEITVYLNQDYSVNETIYVDELLDREEITQQVNDNFADWWSYDVNDL